MGQKFGELLAIRVLMLKLELAGNLFAIEAVDAPVVELATPTAFMRTTTVRTFFT